MLDGANILITGGTGSFGKQSRRSERTPQRRRMQGIHL